MSFFDNLLYPLKWVVAWIMVRAHDLLVWLGLERDSGLSWVLSIVALVIVIRVLLIPLFVRQIKASRGMQILQPDMQRIQKKYKGKTDPASRQAMQQEMMALYREHGTTPFASCLPILAQMPIFFALFRVLWSLPILAQGEYPRGDGTRIGVLTQELAASAEQSTIFGATLSSTFLHSGEVSTRIVSVVLIVMMSLTMLFTQRQLTMKNMPASALDNPMARQQRMLMYLLPIVFAVTGVNFPIGVLIYWTTTNVWSMGQQWYVIRNNPTPGSEAYKAWEERKARRAARRGKVLEDAPEEIEPERPRGQRQQPVSRSRSKKMGLKPGEAVLGEDGAEPEPADDAGTPAEEVEPPAEKPGDTDQVAGGPVRTGTNQPKNPGGKPGSNQKRKKRKKKSRR